MSVSFSLSIILCFWSIIGKILLAPASPWLVAILRVASDLKKGHILLSIPKNSKDKHNVIFSSYRINNFKDEIIISKQNKLEFLNFNNNLKLIFKNKKNYNIPPYSYSKLSEKENIVEINNATDVSQYTNKFLEGCVNQIQNLKEKRKDWKLQYGCITQNGQLVCGNRYK